MAQVLVTPQARRDVDDAISTLNLPADSWARIARSLRTLETFPLSGVELGVSLGHWAKARTGPYL